MQFGSKVWLGYSYDYLVLRIPIRSTLDTHWTFKSSVNSCRTKKNCSFYHYLIGFNDLTHHT
ncbi:hypothetical protein FBZ87_102186 [Nitrospirillum amazonense]|uniref:Uncharacterized protein n=1 Tax=Nitrospirillum amazonense TaxID=28077 RepID=A0A560K8U7_9PROT|nr:hypothetical protein FBZ87_102186 [Nitrospirillum amazonense]